MKKIVLVLLMLGAFAASAAELVTVTEHDGTYTIAVTATAGIGKTACDGRITAPFILAALRDGQTVHRTAVALTPDRKPGARTGRVYLPDGLHWDRLLLHRVATELRGKSLAALPVVAMTPLARIDRPISRLVPPPAPLFPFEKVQDTGVDDKRIVLVIMGDGYTTAEMEKFKNDASTALDGLFSVPPWDKRRGAFNIYRVDVVSNESGADHLELNPPTYADTALGANYGCWSTARLICVDDAKAQEVAASVAAYDLAIVIVNDETYGGSGGVITVASTNYMAVDLVLHEFGHSFGDLADEYEDPYAGYPDGDWEANVSYAYDFDRAQIKWNAWIETSTPLPTPENSGYYELVGMFEGARYKTSGIYRPKENCEMRMLSQPFCEVCIEAQILRIYNFASLLDGTTPAAGTLPYEDGLTITVDTLPCEAISVAFTLNDAPLTGANCTTGSCAITLTAAGMNAGSNILKAAIADDTGEVRNDPSQLSHATIQWEILYDGETVDSDGLTDDDTAVNDTAFDMDITDDTAADEDTAGDDTVIADEFHFPDTDATVKKETGCSCSVVEF